MALDHSFNVPLESSYNAYQEGDVRRDVPILDVVACERMQPGATIC